MYRVVYYKEIHTFQTLKPTYEMLDFIEVEEKETADHYYSRLKSMCRAEDGKLIIYAANYYSKGKWNPLTGNSEMNLLKTNQEPFVLNADFVENGFDFKVKLSYNGVFFRDFELTSDCIIDYFFPISLTFSADMLTLGTPFTLKGSNFEENAKTFLESIREKWLTDVNFYNHLLKGTTANDEVFENIFKFFGLEDAYKVEKLDKGYRLTVFEKTFLLTFKADSDERAENNYLPTSETEIEACTPYFNTIELITN